MVFLAAVFMAIGACPDASARARAARARRADRFDSDDEEEREHPSVFVVSGCYSPGLCGTACLCTVFTISNTPSLTARSKSQIRCLGGPGATGF